MIDHRGFMPLRASSKKVIDLKYPLDANGKRYNRINYRYALTDDYAYFKFPIRRGLVLCLYPISEERADAEHKAATAKFSAVNILKESEVPDTDVKWVSLAHKINQGGKAFFDAIPGKPWTAKFNESDIVATVFYEQSVLMIVNIRFSTYARDGSGQALIAYEFPRKVAEFRKCYAIRLTDDIVTGTVDAMLGEALRPIIVQLVAGWAKTLIK